MDQTFRDAAEAFDALRRRFQKREISHQEFVDGMKKLRLKDGQGRFWMIGAKSGKWYYFDGRGWVQSEPPSQKENKAICIYCGFENKLEADVCARCGGSLGEEEKTCPHCGSELLEPYLTCPNCSRTPEVAEWIEPAAIEKPREDGGRIVLQSVHPLSFFFFGAVAGLLAGFLLGAFAGATDVFSNALTWLPDALLRFQGKLLGAAIYGLLGGGAGFVLAGAALWLAALVLNFILTLVGGVKFTAFVRPPEKKDAEKR
jgi:RNA polymerase subunit RPABC4/transcription elongation factor Spt4